jgi:hypothetical protein
VGFEVDPVTVTVGSGPTEGLTGAVVVVVVVVAVVVAAVVVVVVDVEVVVAVGETIGDRREVVLYDAESPSPVTRLRVLPTPLLCVVVSLTFCLSLACDSA